MLPGAMVIAGKNLSFTVLLFNPSSCSLFVDTIQHRSATDLRALLEILKKE